MRILEYPLVEEGALSGNSSIIVETDDGTRRMTIDELKNNLDISVTFPIGYVYTSFESTSPAELFGGSWLQLEDVFLRAANNLDTGGSDTVTLTTAQMPSHAHGGCMAMRQANVAQGSNYTTYSLVGGSASPSTVTTTYIGGSGAFNNTPKYQNVYAWRRIS